jgi:hypothetical protein
MLDVDDRGVAFNSKGLTQQGAQGQRRYDHLVLFLVHSFSCILSECADNVRKDDEVGHNGS